MSCPTLPELADGPVSPRFAGRPSCGWSLVLLFFLVPVIVPRALALDVDDLAGNLNGEPVTLAEVDDALDGAIRELWTEMHQIIRIAARAQCGERAIARLAASAKQDPIDWRADLWSKSNPTTREIRDYIRQHPELFGDVEPPSDWVAHRLRVTGYRERVAQLEKEALADTLVMHLPAIPSRPRGAPTMPAVVAQCFGEVVTPTDVEQFASFPLYRRRAEVVQTSCRQFEIDHSNPLVLHRLAASQGVSVQELMKQNEGSFEPLKETVIEAEALSQYGDAAPGKRLKARIALEAQRRLPGRMAFLDGIRDSTEGKCLLALPAPPIARLRSPKAASTDLLRVVLFSNFDCLHCKQSFEIFEALASEYVGRIQVDFRHHFPDTWKPSFDEALAAACYDAQDRLMHFAKSRYANGKTEKILLDKEGSEIEECIRDPRTAVRVLLDAEEAQRLGFREAVPSWVIGERPRRGFQGKRVVAETIEEQIKAMNSRADSQSDETRRDVRQSKVRTEQPDRTTEKGLH